MDYNSWGKNTKAVLIGSLCFLVLLGVFLFLPLRILPAQAFDKFGNFTTQADINLGDWLGLTDVGHSYDFQLKLKGYVLTLLILLGLPGLIAYSFWLKQKNKEDYEH